MLKTRRTAVSRFTASALGGAIAAIVPLTLAAQDIDVAALQELDDDRSDVRHENFTIEEIEDMNVVREGEVIGEVEAVLADASGEPVALAVEFDGDRRTTSDEVVVPIEDFEFGTDRREVQTSLSDEELAALPSWDD